MGKMLELLKIVNNTGSSIRNTVYSRKELTESIKEHAPHLSDTLQEAWRKGYIRQGKMFGFVLTKKGFKKYMELRDL